MTRVRFDFANGWSASLVIRDDGDDMRATVTATTAGAEDRPDIVEWEATADQAVRALAQVARRRSTNLRAPSEPIDVDAFALAIAAIPPRAAGVSPVVAITHVEK